MIEIELTVEQRQALQAEQGKAVDVVDPATRRRYVLLALEQYERVKALLDEQGGPQAPEVAGVPPGILRSQQAFWRDLPQLLCQQKLRGQWVCYHGDERIGIGSYQELIRACLLRSLRDDEYDLEVIAPQAHPPWEPEEIEPGGHEVDEVETDNPPDRAGAPTVLGAIQDCFSGARLHSLEARLRRSVCEKVVGPCGVGNGAVGCDVSVQEGASMAGRADRSASHKIAVDKSPLRVHYLFCGLHDKFALNQPADGLLVLLPSLAVRVLGWIFCALGWPVLILGLLSMLGVLMRPTLENALGALCLLGLGLPFALFGVKLLGGPHCRLDSRAGELTIRHVWRTRRRFLADIVGVQVINAGQFGSDEERFTSYQLNLVLDDPSEPRLFVAHNSDLADMGKKARLLADFLHVPLLAAPQIADKTQAEKSEQASRPQAARPFDAHTDPTRDWAKTDEPLPSFDLEAGALGGLRLGDGLEHAQFLGQPDRVEYPYAGFMRLHYLRQGFQLYFQLPQFVELTCVIAPLSDVPPESGQGFSRPRLSGGLQFTPETSIAQVRAHFGAPKTEDDSLREKTLTYARDAFYMVFEFEQSTGRLLTWTVWTVPLGDCM